MLPHSRCPKPSSLPFKRGWGMCSPRSVLIISGKTQSRNALDRAIRKCGIRTAHCETLTLAKKLMACQQFLAVFCEDNFADGSYRDVLREFSHRFKDVPLIVISDCGTWEACVAAMSEGAFDYLGLPFEPHAIEHILRSVLQTTAESEEYFAHAPS